MPESTSAMTITTAPVGCMTLISIYHVTLFSCLSLPQCVLAIKFSLIIYNDHSPAARGFVWLAIAMSVLFHIPRNHHLLAFFLHSLRVEE